MSLKPLFTICLLVTCFHCFGKTHHPIKKRITKATHANKYKEVVAELAEETKNTRTINTGDINPEELLDFAKSNIGTPYRYGSTNPLWGFDCSGFVTYVFNHFGIEVPRGSADYAGVQHKVALEDAQPGDLILFTGTKTHHHSSIGHMGIVVKSYSDTLQFIHSSSGDAHGVTISPLNSKYMARLVKVIRVFPESAEHSSSINTTSTEK